jgi:uncharacterized membrane protein YgdD (TMEM256/DUF423 family)
VSEKNPLPSRGAPQGAFFAVLGAAGLAGAAGVALAAVAAHKVESPALVTAANILMIHAVAVLALAALSAALRSRIWLWPAGSMLAAVALFSGTIAANTLSPFSAPVMLAPIGGSLTILSWVLVAILAVREALAVRSERG